MCSVFKIFSKHIFLIKYIKYNVCRLAVRYVLYIYDISRLRANMWLIFIVFLYGPDNDLDQGRNIVALANIFHI
jgi:hypothetical protein